MQNFNTLDHYSNIGWRSGGITSLNIDAVDAENNVLKLPLNSCRISILYINEKERTKNKL